MPEDNPTSPVESETPTVESEVAATVPTSSHHWRERGYGHGGARLRHWAGNDAGQGCRPREVGGPGEVGPLEPSGPASRPGRRMQPTKTGRTSRRKVREGIVVSNGMEKTAVVAIIERVRHPRYAKTVQRTKRLYAHDEANDVRVGDRVRLFETRPLSKLKRWRVDRSSSGRGKEPEHDPAGEQAPHRRQFGRPRGALHQGARAVRGDVTPR